MSSTEKLEREADELAQAVMGCDRREAWKRVKSGEMSKTPFAARLAGLMFLIDEE